MTFSSAEVSEVPRTVAIHQPNFFPWLGYFDKLARSDVFIFLDNVQYTKTGGSWSNRVKLLGGGEARWFTAPINRAFHGVYNIDQITWAQQPWRETLVRTLHANYAKCAYYQSTMELLLPLIENPENNLASYNIGAINAIAHYVGIDTNHCVRASELPGKGSSTELLVSLTRLVGGARYLCGGGAGGYQDDILFAKASLQLAYQNFQHPIYPQRGSSEFVPGLSVVDALMNAGRDSVRHMLQTTPAHSV